MQRDKLNRTPLDIAAAVHLSQPYATQPSATQATQPSVSQPSSVPLNEIQLGEGSDKITSTADPSADHVLKEHTITNSPQKTVGTPRAVGKEKEKDKEKEKEKDKVASESGVGTGSPGSRLSIFRFPLQPSVEDVQPDSDKEDEREGKPQVTAPVTDAANQNSKCLPILLETHALLQLKAGEENVQPTESSMEPTSPKPSSGERTKKSTKGRNSLVKAQAWIHSWRKGKEIPKEKESDKSGKRNFSFLKKKGQKEGSHEFPGQGPDPLMATDALDVAPAKKSILEY